MKKVPNYLLTLSAASVLALLLWPQRAEAAINLQNTALRATPGLTTNTFGVFLALTTSGANNWFSLSNIAVGTSFSLNSAFTFEGSSYTVFGTNKGSVSLGVTNLSGNVSSLTFSSFTNVAGSQQFAYLLFSNTAAASSVPNGSSLSVWRASDWVLPASDVTGNYGFATSTNSGNPFTQLGSSSSALTSFTVVPEPSTYALLALSGLALGGYAIRRRRRA